MVCLQGGQCPVNLLDGRAFPERGLAEQPHGSPRLALDAFGCEDPGHALRQVADRTGPALAQMNRRQLKGHERGFEGVAPFHECAMNLLESLHSLCCTTTTTAAPRR